MNEYVKMAKDFLKSCNAKMSITFKKCDRYFDDDKEPRNIYNVRIDRDGMTYKFTFGDSIVNTRSRKRPNCYDILACVQKYPVGSFDDFIDEYGYTINSGEDFRRVEKIYKAVCREYEKINRIFGDVMNELEEIY